MRTYNGELWYTRKDVEQAFKDVLDGCHKWHEIQSNTGLSEQRCRQIEDIWCDLVADNIISDEP